jgi:hypothetical protein
MQPTLVGFVFLGGDCLLGLSVFQIRTSSELQMLPKLSNYV